MKRTIVTGFVPDDKMPPINTKSVIGQDSGPQVDHHMPEWEMKDDIVISGISGRFPESDNIDELRDNLYNNVDMVTEDERRWPFGLYGLPTRGGKIKDLTKFDAQFFEVHGKQANMMDPQGRLLLELTHEAIVDAGMSFTHQSLRIEGFQNELGMDLVFLTGEGSFKEYII